MRPPNGNTHDLWGSQVRAIGRSHGEYLVSVFFGIIAVCGLLPIILYFTIGCAVLAGVPVTTARVPWTAKVPRSRRLRRFSYTPGLVWRGISSQLLASQTLPDGSTATPVFRLSPSSCGDQQLRAGTTTGGVAAQ